MVIAISVIGLLSILSIVVSYPTADRYYARLTREDQQTSFYPLSQAQLIEDDPIAIENPQRDHDSIEFMVAPVQISNPLYNFLSKAGDLYRYFRRTSF